MAKEKGMMMKGREGGGPFMNNGKGMCSYKTNPMSAASRVSRECGPALGSPQNGDQAKANKMLQKAHKEWDSMRGMNGI